MHVLAVNHMATGTFQEKKQQQQQRQVFFTIFYCLQGGGEKKEIARARDKKQKRQIALKEKHVHFIAEVRK